MSSRKRKAAAKCILVLYAFITATYPFAHKDFIPLRNNLAIMAANSLYHSLDVNDNDLVCPAHNFAQSTTGTAALAQDFSSVEDVTILEVEYHDQFVAAPANNLSTRAPPQA